jgi:hypothetical protein
MLWLRVLLLSCFVCVPLMGQIIIDVGPQTVIVQSDPENLETSVHECAVAASATNPDKFVATCFDYQRVD